MNTAATPLKRLAGITHVKPSTAAAGGGGAGAAVSVSLLTTTTSPENDATSSAAITRKQQQRWKPLCLYHTQGRCTKTDDSMHLEKFNHDLSILFEVDPTRRDHLQPQKMDTFLVLDLEGKVEILEFPVVMICAKTMKFIDYFHKFVRPDKMSQNRINEYIDGKYGKLGLQQVWHDTAIPFREVLKDFEVWLTHHDLWGKEGGSLNRSAFVTCGNWDIKTKIPQQCRTSGVALPPYFMEWINVKDVYLNFYNRRATGMMAMMNQLGIRMTGSHHLGIDDTKNIARIVQVMLSDGADLQITARRNPAGQGRGNVEFLFENRIDHVK